MFSVVSRHKRLLCFVHDLQVGVLLFSCDGESTLNLIVQVFFSLVLDTCLHPRETTCYLIEKNYKKSNLLYTPDYLRRLTGTFSFLIN